MQFYGLMHVDAQDTAVNVRVRDPAARLALYVHDAVNLARSLRHFGHDLTLLTNARAQLEACAPGAFAAHAVPVTEIAFTTPVPQHVRFRSAHRKLDTFRHLAAQPVPFALLVDLDVECVRALPAAVAAAARDGRVLAYDITDQVRPAYGEARIAADLERVAGVALPACWYGGELLGGPPAFFARLDAMVAEVLPRYLSSAPTLHHQGDEMVVNAALGLLRRQGLAPCDAGALGVVARYWSGGAAHPQPPFREVLAGASLLHLPQDKRLLARRGREAQTRYGAGALDRSYRATRWLQRLKGLARDLARRR